MSAPGTPSRSASSSISGSCRTTIPTWQAAEDLVGQLAGVRRRNPHAVRRADRDANGGRLEHWAEAAEGALALVLLCDQFPRNIYRRTARALAAMRRRGRRRAPRWHTVIRLPTCRDTRTFFFMPFQHSEELADQELLRAVRDPGRRKQENQAKDHRDIVARFGRFPHRNEVLGRESSRRRSSTTSRREALRAVSASKSKTGGGERRDPGRGERGGGEGERGGRERGPMRSAVEVGGGPCRSSRRSTRSR